MQILYWSEIDDAKVTPDLRLLTIDHSAGSKAIAPAPSTPVDTVTMQALALMVPEAVSTATPPPPHATRVAGLFSRTGRFG